MLALALMLSTASAKERLPAALDAVAVNEHLGETIDTTLAFTDHTGKQVTMGDYLDGEMPVLVTLNYFTCKTICTLQLNELTEAMAQLDWTPGEQYRVVTVSIDPNEDAELAAGKRASYLVEYGRGANVDWTFLTGTEENIMALADDLGIQFAYDETTEQYAHPAVLPVLDGKGMVARYLYGFDYTGQDLRFAFMEASAGNLGSPVEKLVLSCFAFDMASGRYSPQAFGVMRIGGLVGLGALIAFCFLLFRREGSWLRRTA
mgnify:CR=1 FL=1